MKIKSLFYLLILIFSECQNRETAVCKSKTVMELNSVCEAFESQFVQILSQDSVDVTGLITLNEITKELKYDLIDYAGGIRERTNQLYDGCKTGGNIHELFNKELHERINSSLNSVSPDSPFYENLRFILDYYFLADKRYFDDSYVKNTEVAILCLDVITVQLFIYQSVIGSSPPVGAGVSLVLKPVPMI